MEGVKLTLALIAAIVLQWTLRNVNEAFAYVDLPLIVIVYAALQRNAIRALIFAFLSGIAVDALSGGLLGSGAFAKVVVAFAVTEVARRVYLDNLLLRIPVIASASLVSNLVFVGVNRLFGQGPVGNALITLGYSLMGTMIGGTLVFMLMEAISAGKLRPKRREMFTPRRQTRRRNPIRLGK